jgi:hypothetical protein
MVDMSDDAEVADVVELHSDLGGETGAPMRCAV